MSISSLARNLAADGRFSTLDAQKLLRTTGTATPQAADEVKKLLQDPQFTGKVTPGALRRLNDFISAAAPSGGAAGTLPDGTKLFVKGGVFVNEPNAALPATPQAYGQTLLRAARVFAEPGQDVAAKLSMADKTAVVDRALVGLAQCPAGANAPAGYTPSQAAQQRSSTATVLREVMGSLNNADPQGKLLQDKCLKSLVDLIKKETNPGLRDHMSFHLHGLRDTLATPEQKAIVDDAYKAFAPTAPPYDQWFANGNKTLNVVCHTGGEFYESEIGAWKRDGFSVVQQGDYSKPTILEKDINGTKVRMKMYNGDSGTFDDMKDKDTHVVAYSGHSGWGKNMPRALRTSPDMTNPPKVMLIHQCCGQGVANKIRDKYPEADLVTTRYSSYEHEDHFAFKTFLEGVAGRKGWTDIHDKIEGGGYSNSRQNYVTPADEFTRMKLYDRDHDGRADLLDKVYDFDTFDVPGDTASAFVAATPSKRDQVLAGTRIHNASQIVNTTLGFSDFLDHIERGNPFVSGGYFTPGPGEENKMVRIVEEKVDLKAKGLDGKRSNLDSPSTQTVYKLQLNERFAHASEEVVKAASFMEAAMKYGDGSSKAEKALQGLTLIAHSTDIDEEWGREEMIFDELRKAYGLPDTVTYSDARRSLKADEHTYAGSDKGIEQWKKTLGADGMKAIEQALANR
ncbi:MAG: hypothetical protein HY904_09460 [Deltaproteobacteria bacterium]|nr:hypothetical protein [Deltaproteobacteria bacterium]